MGMNSKMAPVGQTRTHSPHQVQPAWSGSPSPPTMISVCSPRCATSSTPTSWMSSHARTQRVHRMQMLMSCWIITVARALVAVRGGRSGAQRRRVRVVPHHVLLELVPRLGAAAVLEVVAGVALEQELEHALPVVHRRRRLGLHHHAVGGLGGAGGRELALALHRDQADAAVGRRSGAWDTSRAWGCRCRPRARRRESWRRPRTRPASR